MASPDPGPLMSESTALPLVPQPLHFYGLYYGRNVLFMKNTGHYGPRT